MVESVANTPSWDPKSLLKFRRWGPFAGYLLLQAIVVAGLPTPRFPDSASYTALSFTGANDRLFTLPLFYSIFPPDPLKICFQIVVAAIAWWVLASTVARYVTDRRVALGIRLVLLVLGLCAPIASWNSTILSESLAISLTVLVFAAWLHYANSPSLQELWWLLAAAILWMFVRPDSLLIGTIVVVVWLVSMAVRRQAGIRLVLAVAMAAICAAGLVVSSNLHQTDEVSIGDLIAQRILPNATYTAWFVDHGMPYSSAIAGYAHDYPATPLLHDPALGPWISSQGLSTYLEFVAQHPVPEVLSWLADLSGEESSVTVSPSTIPLQPNPSPSLLSPTANYGRHRDVVPEVIQSLLFQQGQIGDVIFLAGGAFALAAVARRRFGHDRRLLVPCAVVVLAIVQTGFIWLLVGTELDRLGMVPAVEIRIALWTIAAFSLDRLLTRHDAAAPVS